MKLKGYGHYDQCDSLKIVEIKTGPRFQYIVEAMKPCGLQRMVRDARGVFTNQQMIKQGMKISVASDDSNAIDRHLRVELRKCRGGNGDQEFILTPTGAADERSDLVRIEHKLTGLDLSSALDAKSPLFNVTQVFDDGAFEGSGDYFYLKVVSSMNRHGGPVYSYLASGRFGQNEYSMVQTHSEVTSGFEEQQFAMWQFQPVLRDESIESGSTAVDEHAEWLVRMTQIIGIDYLTQLPPWHLLDVERDASKGDVKSRFRELSRSFHPDKLVNQSEKRELFERIFVLLQNAYQGLKGANEAEKEKFKVNAESGSQLFAHSQYVVELLPFHWTKLNNEADKETATESRGERYTLTTQFDATQFNNMFSEEESEPSVQLWLIFLYSARCGMSRAVTGMIDLVAKHLEEHENIKVGAYGCNLHREIPPNVNDPLVSDFMKYAVLLIIYAL